MASWTVNVLCVFFAFQLISAFDFDPFEEENDLKTIMNILSKPRVPERYQPLKFVKHKFAKASLPQATEFSWRNCGGATDPLKLVNVTISPDPIALPGKVTVSAAVALKMTEKSPIKVALVIKKKVFGVFIEIPCVDGVGSCVYEDICDKLPSTPCPDPLPKYHIPCHCPFNSGTYYLPKYTFDIQASLPSFLESGDYEVQANLNAAGGKAMGCISAKVSLK